MLTGIPQIANIGLLQNVKTDDDSFGKFTRVYAENGHGKTTLCAIFRSLNNNDPDILNRRQTVDQKGKPLKVIMRFNKGEATFENGKWAGDAHANAFEIYDSYFIKNNVYTGSTVMSSQRQNLLSFALGEQSVNEAEKQNALKQQRKQKNDDLKECESQIQQICGSGCSINDFEKLQSRERDKQFEVELSTLQRKLSDSRNAAKIQRKPEIATLKSPFPTVSISNLKEVLHSSIESLSEEATAKLDELTHGKPHYAEWLKNGLEYMDTSQCPFCMQETSNAEIIEIYREYFSKAYNNLLAQIHNLVRDADAFSNNSIIEQFVSELDTISAGIANWNDLTEVQEIQFDTASILSDISLLAAQFHDALRSKSSNPLTPIETVNSSDKQYAVSPVGKLEFTWKKVSSLIQDLNAKIKDANTAITQYKTTIAEQSTESISQQIQKLEIEAKRGEQTTIKLFRKRAELAAQESSLAQALKQSNDDYKKQMNDIISNYKEAINRILKTFGVSFRISDMHSNLRSSDPQADYTIEMRNCPVSLQVGKAPSFEEALSEGDKSTLALAFFLAKVESDPNLSSKIIVVDDPISSVDRGRRENTEMHLAQISASANQMILLSHDPYFLDEMQTSITKRYGNAFQVEDWKTLEITSQEKDEDEHDTGSSNDSYSIIEPCSIQEICTSEYSRMVKQLDAYLHHTRIGQKRVDFRDIARNLRIIVETYLKRRYPLFLENNCDMLGGIQSTLAKKYPSSEPILSQIREARIFGNSQEHAGNIEIASPILTDASVRAQATAVWELLRS